ncbi:hypothetical protein ACHAWF_003838 [Thalassiosira exigua]
MQSQFLRERPDAVAVEKVAAVAVDFPPSDRPIVADARGRAHAGALPSPYHEQHRARLPAAPSDSGKSGKASAKSSGKAGKATESPSDRSIVVDSHGRAHHASRPAATTKVAAIATTLGKSSKSSGKAGKSSAKSYGKAGKADRDVPRPEQSAYVSPPTIFYDPPPPSSGKSAKSEASKSSKSEAAKSAKSAAESEGAKSAKYEGGKSGKADANLFVDLLTVGPHVVVLATSAPTNALTSKPATAKPTIKPTIAPTPPPSLERARTHFPAFQSATEPVGGSCAGDPCDDEAWCRTSHGTCGPGRLYCNRASIWTSACPPRPTSVPTFRPTGAPTGRPTEAQRASPASVPPTVSPAVVGVTTFLSQQSPSHVEEDPVEEDPVEEDPVEEDPVEEEWALESPVSKVPVSDESPASEETAEPGDSTRAEPLELEVGEEAALDERSDGDDSSSRAWSERAIVGTALAVFVGVAGLLFAAIRYNHA